MSPADPLAPVAEAMRQVRIAYDRYALGLERLEPLKEREAAKKMLRGLMGETSANTAFKFRLQTLQASWNTWEALWQRLARQIEEGTYRRDKHRAAGAASTPSAAPAAAAAAAAQMPSGDVAPGLVSEQTALALYRELEAARAVLQITTPGPSLASLRQTLNKQAQSIVSQYKCQAVAFKVAVKDGKPILKATPR